MTLKRRAEASMPRALEAGRQRQLLSRWTVTPLPMAVRHLTSAALASRVGEASAVRGAGVRGQGGAAVAEGAARALLEREVVG